jgi:hypothetical protein
MQLRTVTITGADDAVNPRELVAISRQYPWVEWGILRSVSREGTPRYPTAAWMIRLIDAVEAAPSTRFSVHLCGEFARRAMRGHLIETWGAKRVQLNGFSWCEQPIRLPPVLGIEWICQCSTPGALQYASQLRHFYDVDVAVAVLWDRSGGRGVQETDWPDPVPGLPRGYAGRIGPDNVIQVAKTIAAKPDFIVGPLGFWIDMETGVRTDDRFDLDKVVDVLAKAERYTKGDI